MRNRAQIYWFGFIFSCIVHFGLLLLCLLFSLGIVNPESLGITNYLLDYTGRLTTIVVINSLLLTLYFKKKYYKDLNRVLIVFLLNVIFFLDTLGNFFSALASNLSTIATTNGFEKNGNINNNRAKLFHLLISCIVFEHLCTFFSPSLNCIFSNEYEII